MNLCWAVWAAAVGYAAAHSSPEQTTVEHVLKTVPNGDLDLAASAFEGFAAINFPGIALGEEKGNLLRRAVKLAAELAAEPDIVLLELGAHCGDGTLHLLRALEIADKPNSLVVSAETNKHWAELGKRLIGHSLSSDGSMRYLHTDWGENEGIAELIEQAGLERVNLLVMDHDQSLFNEDLRDLLEAGVLAENALIVADNALTKAFMMEDYLELVSGDVPGSSKLFFDTEMWPVSRPYPDRVAVSRLVSRDRPDL